MIFINQPTISEINQFLEKINSYKNYFFDGNTSNNYVKESNLEVHRKNKKDIEALLKDGLPAIAVEGENVSLGNSKGTESGNVSNASNLLDFETDLILRPDDGSHTCLIESYKAVIKQQADKLNNYVAQIKAEKEKCKSTVSEISVLKSEVVCLSNALNDHRAYVTSLKSRNANDTADLRRQIDDLKATIKDLLRLNTLNEKKIAELEENKCTSERTLNETIDRIRCELNVLKTELESAKSELSCSRKILNNKNAENQYLMERNESLTHDLDNLQKSLVDLKSEYLSSIEKAKKDSADRINDLEHELDRSTSERQKYLQLQRIENQNRDYAADTDVIINNLIELKRQNTALDLRKENTLRPSVKTIDETESCLNYGRFVSEQYDCDTSKCLNTLLGTSMLSQSVLKTEGSCSDDVEDYVLSCKKDERIEELQRKLDELEEAYKNKARRYQKIIVKIDTEAQREKKQQEQAFKSNMKIKENQIADIMEGFSIYSKTKKREIEHERNNFKDLKKQLKDQKTLLELEEMNAYERMKVLNEKYDTEREKVAELSSHIDGLKTLSTARNKPFAADKKLVHEKPWGAGKKLVNDKPRAFDKKLINEKPRAFDKKLVNDKPRAFDKKLMNDKPRAVDKKLMNDKPRAVDKKLVNNKPRAADITLVNDKPQIVDKKLVNNKQRAVNNKLMNDKQRVVDRKLVSDKPRAVDKKLANVSKSGSSGDEKPKLPVINATNVGLRNSHATKTTKIPIITYNTNKGVSPANKLMKNDSRKHSDDSPLLRIYNQKQRERDEKISELREKYKKQKASGVRKGQA